MGPTGPAGGGGGVGDATLWATYRAVRNVDMSNNEISNVSAVRVSAFGPVTMTPANSGIAGLQVWYDGNDPNGNGVLPSAGATVSTWVDKSGNARNASLLTGAGTATFSAGTYNSVAFGGGGLFGNSLSLGGTSPFTCLIVKSTATTDGNFRASVSLNANGGTRPNVLMNYKASTNFIWLSGGNAGNDGNTTTQSMALNTRYVVANYWSTTGSVGTTQINVDGTSYTASTASPAFLTTGATMYIGAANGPTEYWNGNIFEILVYNATLSTTDRQRLEGYLAWKWGVQTSLPAGHPFRNAAPTAVGATTVNTYATQTIDANYNFQISASNNVRIAAPTESRSILTDACGTSLTLGASNYSGTWRIRNTAMNALTLPTLTTTDNGAFWNLFNSTASNLNLIVTPANDISAVFLGPQTSATIFWNGSNYYSRPNLGFGGINVQEITGTSLTLAASNYNNYFHVTNTGFNAMTLPSATAITLGGLFWSIRNATAGNLSITLTNTLTLTSPLVIPSGNSATLAISGVTANRILLF